MKTTTLFSFSMSVIIGLAILAPQSSKARDYRKSLPNCVSCKMPVYSYYRFKTYANHQAVYSWQISGHSKCGLEPAVEKSVTAKQEGAKPVVEVKMASAATAVKPSGKKQAATDVKTTTPKSESEQPAYSRPVQPAAYGGGSGYVQHGAYGGPVYGGGHQCHSACRHGANYGNGYGYGTGTVKRTVTVTRSTPSTTMYGSFPGSSTRTYSTRTRVSNRRGGYGGYSGGGRYGGYGLNIGLGYCR